MEMNDMVLISVDDHICEPGTLFDNHLSGELYESAPKFRLDKNGKNFWEYQGMRRPSVGLNAVVGRPLDEYGMEPNALDQLRPGFYDPDERVKDMDVNGIAASLNFGNAVGFDGTFFKAPDKDLSARHMQAYNDWHIDEWCGSHPGRFIPCGILPTWDMDKTIAEIKRLKEKGCHAVSISENPTAQGLPSIHNEYWKPFWKAINDYEMTICLHIGSGNPAPHASIETPIEAWITTMPLSISMGAADWLNLGALHEYPNMRIALAEGSLGWVPYFMERADFSNSRHKFWTNSRFQDMKPSDLFKRHFLNCFIDDAFGLKNVDELGVENIAYETDYPHSDALWPEAPEYLWKTINHLNDEQIDLITHGNAMRDFKFDLFSYAPREELTVGALRAKAKAAGVDVTPVSAEGARPVDHGVDRPVTSGDLMKMFKGAQAELEAMD